MNLNKLAPMALIAALLAGVSHAADVDAGAGAKIIAPLQIAKATDLYFGTIAPSLTQADTVVVTPAGARNCGAALTCLDDNHTAAAFDVYGEADRVYTIDLPTSIMIENGQGQSMVVNAFAGSKASGTLVAGEDSFTVGGTLAVASNQAAGEYLGSFTVTVEYQ